MSTASLAQRIASDVRAELGRQQLSINQMSKDLGIPYTVLRRRVAGLVPFDIDELCRVAAYLGLNPAHMLAAGEAALVSDGAA